MLTITTKRDLRNWANDQAIAAGGTTEDADALADEIQDDEHPEWGRAWTEYLGSVDVVASFANGTLLFRS